jgi:pyruvate,orthophosphate dikinase
MAQSVFFFGNGEAEGTRSMKNVLGGKGANLAEMTNLGVPVPPGFTIACAECMSYLRDGKYTDKLRAEVEGNIARLEDVSGKKFGDPRNPLLVSVRSGAPVSMPGMMETILNLGLNDRTAVGLAKQSNNARFAYDSYRRFIQMYSDVVLGVASSDFEHLLKAHRMTTGAKSDADLNEDALRNLVEEYKSAVGSYRSCLEVMDAQEGAGLPQGERHPGRPRHGGECRLDGLRQSR